MTPTVWLGGAVAICLALFAGGVAIKHAAELKGARNEGIAIGTGAAATATLEAATQTAEAERRAEEEISITADRKRLIEICRRSASCIDREKFK